MEIARQKAIQLLQGFKGENYTFGVGAFDQLGQEVAKIGKKVSVVFDGLGQGWATVLEQQTKKILMAV